MCTVTWLRKPGAFTLFFNRDEQRTRAPAEPPSVRRHRGTALLAPRDPQAGGTWLAVNEHALIVAMLNYYERESTPAGANLPRAARSRGQLALDAAAEDSPQAVVAMLDAEPLDAVRPFHLLAFDGRSGRAMRATWDGATIAKRTLEDRDRPVTTSSFQTARVLARRREAFASRAAEGGLDANDLEAYHFSRDVEGDPFSVFMTRLDAMTVSVTRVTVRGGEAEMRYHPRSEEDGRPQWFREALLLTDPRM